jgi:hypothetical protein
MNFCNKTTALATALALGLGLASTASAGGRTYNPHTPRNVEVTAYFGGVAEKEAVGRHNYTEVSEVGGADVSTWLEGGRQMTSASAFEKLRGKAYASGPGRSMVSGGGTATVGIVIGRVPGM